MPGEGGVVIPIVFGKPPRQLGRLVWFGGFVPVLHLQALPRVASTCFRYGQTAHEQATEPPDLERDDGSGPGGSA